MSRLGNKFLAAPALACAFALTGCEAVRSLNPEHVRGPDYQPANVHQAPTGLPLKLRRVAVLPLLADAAGAQADAGIETMQAVLLSELKRAGVFEIVAVNADDLRHATGRGSFTAEEKLPPTLLQKLRERHACEAVLFARLTHLRPYPPLAIGWSFKLVECAKPGEAPRIFWAAEEIFDAGNPTVVNAARRYYQAALKVPGPLADSTAVLQSPRQFAQYTLHALALTLPARELPPQVSAPPADPPLAATVQRPASAPNTSD
jgi:hypothetical protein